MLWTHYMNIKTVYCGFGRKFVTTYKTTRVYNSEDHDWLLCQCENFTSRICVSKLFLLAMIFMCIPYFKLTVCNIDKAPYFLNRKSFIFLQNLSRCIRGETQLIYISEQLYQNRFISRRIFSMGHWKKILNRIQNNS